MLPPSRPTPRATGPHTPWDLDAAQRKQMVDDFNDAGSPDQPAATPPSKPNRIEGYPEGA